MDEPRVLSTFCRSEKHTTCPLVTWLSNAGQVTEVKCACPCHDAPEPPTLW